MSRDSGKSSPERDIGSTLRPRPAGPPPGDGDIVLPSQDDPLVRASAEGLGGPVGRHVRPAAGWWTPLRVLVALTLLAFGAGVASKATCHEQMWSRGDTQQYVHACYSDVPHLFRERGLVDGKVPYLDTAVEYPVLIGLVMGGTAAVARTSDDDVHAQARRFYDVNALLLGALAVVTVLAVAALAGRRPWDASLVALAPASALALTINWDIYAVVLVTLALLAWARHRPGVAGMLLGLAAAAKFYPLVLLGPLFLLCLRAGRLRAFATTLGAGLGTWLVVNLPVAVAAPDNWARFYTYSEEREPSFGSVWYWFVHVVRPLDVGTVNLLGAGLFGAFALGIAWLALRAPRRPRLAQLAFLTLAAFCLANKVYSPQFVLWLVPLAALARPRWRDFLIWQVCEVVYFYAVWLHLASFTDTERGLPTSFYWAGLWLHVTGTVYLCACVVRDVLRPHEDPLRADCRDDPTGGVLDAAPDVVALRR